MIRPKLSGFGTLRWTGLSRMRRACSVARSVIPRGLRALIADSRSDCFRVACIRECLQSIPTSQLAAPDRPISAILRKPPFRLLLDVATTLEKWIQSSNAGGWPLDLRITETIDEMIVY